MAAAARTRTSPAGSEGFTLLELLLVLAIMAVFATLTAPSIARWRDQFAFRARVGELERALTLTRYAAIREGEPQLVTVPEPERVDCAGLAVIDLAPQGRVASVEAWLAETGARTPRFHFYPDGSADPVRMVLEGPDRQVVLALNPLTGKTGVEWRERQAR